MNRKPKEPNGLIVIRDELTSWDSCDLCYGGDDILPSIAQLMSMCTSRSLDPKNVFLSYHSYGDCDGEVAIHHHRKESDAAYAIRVAEYEEELACWEQRYRNTLANLEEVKAELEEVMAQATVESRLKYRIAELERELEE